ncbi:MAG: hypothetical protein HGA55_02575 [Methanoregulaceae archaeon]|nr:hypothetical protein [Methanoregulaceae archaeon]
MRGQKDLYDLLESIGIKFEYHEHHPLATIEDAKIHWKDFNSGRCKNIFFRNHKGDRHYLVILEHLRQLNIHDLEKRLKQGKLSFASDQRLKKYLGVQPGSVSPFGLINDGISGCITVECTIFFGNGGRIEWLWQVQGKTPVTRIGSYLS